MAKIPLRQTGLIDVALWEPDAEFAVFPQGARAKEAVFSPSAPNDLVITPNKRYLFKRSKKSYPDQFWGEIVAYRVGCLLDIDVPPAFAAWNSNSEHCAALIEWFYVDGEEVSSLAGDFLLKLYPDFDREKGQNHNLRHITVMLRAFAQHGLLEKKKWRQWWADALMFDALIGNTDRHQDNWGFLFSIDQTKEVPARLMPLFDNGTSLGHERFLDRVATWSPSDFLRYIQKGKHHVSWSLDEPRIKGHLALLERAIEEWPETKTVVANRIARLTDFHFVDELSDLVHIAAPVPFTEERMNFILRLLAYRLDALKALLL